MTDGAQTALDPALLVALLGAAVGLTVAVAWWRRRGTMRAPDSASSLPGSHDVDQIMAARAVRRSRLRVAPGAAPDVPDGSRHREADSR